MKDKLIQLLKGQLALLLSSKKIDYKIWYFSSRNNTDFNYNSEYLFLYVKEHFQKVAPRFVINDVEKRKRLQAQYGEEFFVETVTLRGMRNALKAGVWFTSAGLPVYALGTGKHRLIINLWHGVPLKKIALLEENVSKLTRMYFKEIFSKNYSFILTTSTQLISIMAESFDVAEDRVKVWGQPRNDMLFEMEKQTKRIEDFVHVGEYDKVVLYAPTYRDQGKTRWFPFDDFEMKRFQTYLKEHRILFCLRPHAEEKLNPEFFSSNIVNLDSTVIDDITGQLYLFDMLITDYSSIYIDYLLLDRPIIFLPYDKDEYLKCRGMNFEYDEVTPGQKPKSYESFIETLESELQLDTQKLERIRVNDIFNEVKGPCSKTICEQVYGMMEKH